MPSPQLQPTTRLAESDQNLADAAGLQSTSPTVASADDIASMLTSATVGSRNTGATNGSFMGSQRQNLVRLRQRFQQVASKALGTRGATNESSSGQASAPSSIASASTPFGSPFASSSSSNPDDSAKSLTGTSKLTLDEKNTRPNAPIQAWAYLEAKREDEANRAELLQHKIAPNAESELQLAHGGASPSQDNVSLSHVTVATPEPTPDEVKTDTPQADSKPLLVLDLDETLIHSSLVPRRASDFWIEVIQNGDVRTREVFWVYKRPGVDKFLADLCEYYTIYVFTAGIREYASQILDRLDPSGKMISGRLYRDECSEIKNQGTFAKDLTKVSTELNRVILVDNTPACFSLQPSNGLPIKSWYTDLTDRQLYRLREFLIRIATVPDVRLVLSEWTIY